VSDRVEPGLTVRGPIGTGDPMLVRSPWDGAEIARIPTTTLDEADGVLSRARAAAEAFRWTPAWKRAAILERTSHLIEDNAEQIARIIAAEGGKPLKDARVEAKRGASTFRWAAEESKRTAGELIEMDADPSGEHRFGWTIREPRGVIVAISPFNFPLNLVAHKVAPALAGANAVILKPASSTPLTALRLAELLTQAGLPRNVLQVVVGPGSTLGARLVSDERVNMVTFTGSPPVGRQIASDAGMKMLTLELGNNSATIIDEDANLDLAVQRVVAGGFVNSGQVCISVQRVVVHEKVYQAFMDKLVPAVKALTVGDPMDETTEVGAHIRRAEDERVKGWVQEAV
jgi:acyl-CoA reductase-like NAD-dependent aldehyde dehydrogenase